jgi:N-methylhydantoinase A
VGSAIGFLRAPFSFEATRSAYMRLSSFDPAAVRALLAELQDEAAGFVRSCDAEAPIAAEFKAYMRYTGQGWEIPVALAAADAEAPDAGRYLDLFQKEYAVLFGRVVDGADVEITVWAVNAATPTPRPAALAAMPAAAPAQVVASRRMFDAGLGHHVEAAVVERAGLAPGQTVAGPAVVTETETTIIVPAGFTAITRPDGCIELRRGEQKE